MTRQYGIGRNGQPLSADAWRRKQLGRNTVGASHASQPATLRRAMPAQPNAWQQLSAPERAFSVGNLVVWLLIIPVLTTLLVVTHR